MTATQEVLTLYRDDEHLPTELGTRVRVDNGAVYELVRSRFPGEPEGVWEAKLCPDGREIFVAPRQLTPDELRLRLPARPEPKVYYRGDTLPGEEGARVTLANGDVYEYSTHGDDDYEWSSYVWRRVGNHDQGEGRRLPAFVQRNLPERPAETPEREWEKDLIPQTPSAEVEEAVEAALDAYKKKVAKVAMRYARENEWCDQFRTALREVDITPPEDDKVRARVRVEFDVVATPKDRDASEVDQGWFYSSFREASVVSAIQDNFSMDGDWHDDAELLDFEFRVTDVKVEDSE